MKPVCFAAVLGTFAVACSTAPAPPAEPTQTAAPQSAVAPAQSTEAKDAPAATEVAPAAVVAAKGPEAPEAKAADTTQRIAKSSAPAKPAVAEVTPEQLAEPTNAAAEKPAEDPAAAFKRVESDKVCMVNNHFMGRAQIPVVVEGKTYFGCCPMCEKRLAKDPTSRTAKDPISGKVVDKAVAVIGADASGTVKYFENAKNLETYASR